jgi:hypothetical protein
LFETLRIAAFNGVFSPLIACVFLERLVIDSTALRCSSGKHHLSTFAEDFVWNGDGLVLVEHAWTE